MRICGERQEVHAITLQHVIYGDSERVRDLADVKDIGLVKIWVLCICIRDMDGPVIAARMSPGFLDAIM